MLKTPLKIAALSAVSLTLLTACGGSGGGDKTNPVLNPLDPPSSSAVAVADRVVSIRGTGPYSNAGTFVSDGEIVSNEVRTARSLDDSYNIKVSETQDTFALVQSGENLVMTVNGTAYTFTPNEISPAVPANDNDDGDARPAVYSWDATGAGSLPDITGTNDLRTVLDETHPTIQGTYIEYYTWPNLNEPLIDINLDYTQGFATIGTRTPLSAVALQTATATYTGSAVLELQSNFTKTVGQDPEAVTSASGVLTMTVDFDGNTVSGTSTDSDGDITFGVAPIVGNGFAGTFTIDSDLRTTLGLTSASTGNYSGHFFGPAADDLAGVMRFDGANTSGSAIGLGGFRGDRQ